MPNWCSNQLIVIGKQEDIVQLRNAVCGLSDPDVPLDFNRIIPMPSDEEHLRKELLDKYDTEVMALVGSKTDLSCAPMSLLLYAWAIRFWGTKWNLTDETFVGEGGNLLIYAFSTAWSPPERVVKALAAQHPKLSIRHEWWEIGCDFAGYVEYLDGKAVEGEEGRVSDFEFSREMEPEVEFVGEQRLAVPHHPGGDCGAGTESTVDNTQRTAGDKTAKRENEQ